MKKVTPSTKNPSIVKRGYNEKNPGQAQGAFPPSAASQQPAADAKSNAADKKVKQDES